MVDPVRTKPLMESTSRSEGNVLSLLDFCLRSEIRLLLREFSILFSRLGRDKRLVTWGSRPAPQPLERAGT